MNDQFTESTPYRVLRLVVSIGFWIALGYSAVMLVAIVLSTFVPQIGDIVAASTLHLDGFTITLPGSAPNPTHAVGTIGMLAAGLICIWMLRNIVKSLRTGSPFTAENVKRIRVIGWVVFGQAYLHELSNYLFVNRISIDTAVITIKAQFTLLPDGVLLAICILVLAEVFRYGCTLQREHDTTV